MSEILVEQNCKRCINYEICQSSGCQIKKDIQNLQKENQQLKEQVECLLNQRDRILENATKTSEESVEFIGTLNQQLKQRDEVIDEATKKCKLEINASSYQYEQRHRQQDLCYKVAHERILKILQKYKGDNNEY